MNRPTEPPSTVELAALLQEIGPLPLTGQAWPDWVKILGWILLALVGWQIVTNSIQMAPDALNPGMLAGVVLCFLALAVIAWFMQTSITTMDGRGIRQSWFTRRDVAWAEILSARYIPSIFSRRLFVITRAGRTVVFQGGTRELEKAFTRIAATYGGPRR